MPIDLARVEHTILRPQLLPPQMHREVTEAMRLGLGGVVVAPVWVSRIATMLRESSVKLRAAISFPYGTSKSTVKAIEATSCIKDGASGLWIVPHLPHLIRADFDALKFELLEIARAARATRQQVIIDLVIDIESLRSENPSGLEASLTTACRAARESGFDGVVCGLGIAAIATSDRCAESVGMLRECADGLRVVANGVYSPDQVQHALDAGADAIASHRAVELLAKDVT